jgi:hypothetical protein
VSDLVELQHEAHRALLRMGIYKFNPNHDEQGRFATGPHQGGRKDLRVDESGGGTGTETERLTRAKDARQSPGFSNPQWDPKTLTKFTPAELDELWDGGGNTDIHELGREDLVGIWQSMQPCKQMRSEAARLVGLGEKPPVTDPLRDKRAEWGGADYMANPVDPAFQLLHQLHANGGELPVNGVLYRGSGVDPAVIKGALKTGDQFDMPLASFAGAHPWLSTRYGGDNPESDAQKKATVIFQLNNPKAALRAGAFSPVYEHADEIPPDLRDTYGVKGMLGTEIDAGSDTDTYYHKVEGFENQENDQGEFISGGRFKVKSMKTKYVKGILQPGQKALVVELEHVGVFNPWTGEVE